MLNPLLYSNLCLVHALVLFKYHRWHSIADHDGVIVEGVVNLHSGVVELVELQ